MIGYSESRSGKSEKSFRLTDCGMCASQRMSYVLLQCYVLRLQLEIQIWFVYATDICNYICIFTIF